MRGTNNYIVWKKISIDSDGYPNFDKSSCCSGIKLQVLGRNWLLTKIRSNSVGNYLNQNNEDFQDLYPSKDFYLT